MIEITTYKFQILSIRPLNTYKDIGLIQMFIKRCEILNMNRLSQEY